MNKPLCVIQAKVEASIPGATGTYLEHRSFYTNASGVDVLHRLLPRRLLLFLLLLGEEGHLGVTLDRLLLVELLHGVVGPRDHLSGLGAAPPVAGGGALHDGGLHQCSTTGGGQVR